MGENKAIELLSKVLHHVVPFRLAVNQKVEADFLLELNNVLNLLLDEFVILLSGKLALSMFGARLTDFFGLLVYMLHLELISCQVSQKNSRGRIR